jgi:hypothetical protein
VLLNGRGSLFFSIGPIGPNDGQGDQIKALAVAISVLCGAAEARYISYFTIDLADRPEAGCAGRRFTRSATDIYCRRR